MRTAGSKTADRLDGTRAGRAGDRFGCLFAWWVAAVVAGVGLLAAAGPARAGWQAPVTLSSSASGDSPKVGVDARGDGIAVWSEAVGSTSPGNSSFVVNAAFRPAGGGWQTPVKIAAASGTSVPFGVASPAPSVAVDPRGDAVVVWTSRPSFYAGLVEAAVKPAGGSWGQPVAVSRGGEFPAGGVQVAIDRRGNALVVWWSAPLGIRAAFRRVGGPWDKPTTVSPGGPYGLPTGLAFDTRGNAIAVWARAYRTSIRTARGAIQAAFRPVGHGWRKPVDVGPANLISGDPDVAFDRRGNATVVWVYPGSVSILRSAFRSASGIWGKPMSVARRRGVGVAYYPRVALDPQGNALAVWSYPNSSGSSSVIQAAFRPPASAWRTPVKLATIPNLTEPELVIDPAGNALVMWVENGGIVRAANRPARGVWHKPLTVAVGPGCASCKVWPADAAFDSHGNAVAVWMTFLGRNFVQAATFTPDRP